MHILDLGPARPESSLGARTGICYMRKSCTCLKWIHFP